ncbi:hypothetical protein IAR55_001172 [Kwoniella newhampshirensis]|uniref:PIPK domain-containing protein n=1 Tax=Kwoniella newhampshirensis TaxID=1651941 RepID=A0AAW0Z4Y2_9TREE
MSHPDDSEAPAPTSSSRSASPSKPLPDDPFPPRSTSPPLPPRKNAFGLPPSYLRHLRRLLHQWLEQQIRTEEDGLPRGGRGRSGEEEEHLWSDETVLNFEKAIWEGAVIPQLNSDRRNGKNLLDLDLNAWVPASAKRKRLWKEEMIKQRHAGGTEDSRTAKATKDTVRSGASAHVRNDTDAVPREGRLTVPATPPYSADLSISPSRMSSRTSSMSSFLPPERRRDAAGIPDSPGQGEGRATDENEEGDDQKAWCEVITALKGFQELSLDKRDEWEVINDDVPSASTVQPDLPGAFPQLSNLDYQSRSVDLLQPTASSSRTQFSELGLPVPSAATVTAAGAHYNIVKPVFCLHFLGPLSHIIGGLGTRRKESIGASSTGSIGSSGGKRWWGGSGGRWSDITVGPGLINDQILEIDFFEGEFVLPTSPSPNSQSVTERRSRAAMRKRKSVLNTFLSSPAPSVEDTTITSDSEVDESQGNVENFSSTWSGTQRSTIRTAPGSWSKIISGADDDIPRDQVADGQVMIVGGTMVIKGVTKDIERRALENVLKLVLYTIQTMTIELDLLDAFRVTREPDDPPLPPKPTFDMTLTSNLSSETRQSSDLRHENSLKDREKSKGFFQRLGMESKVVWDGLLGKRRSSTSQDRQASANAALTQSAVLPLPASLALSTTPGLVFPMPPLLLRVKEEDRVRREKAQQEISEEPLSAHDGLPTSVTSGLLTPHRGPGLTSHSIRGRALGYRLGGDVRAGLGALTSGIDTFDGWIGLQRLDTLYCVGGINDGTEGVEQGIRICHKPKLVTFVFWDAEQDQSIKEFAQDLTEELSEDTMICPRSGCTVPELEHIRWWIHAGQRLGIKVESTDAEEGATEVWVKCKQCGSTSGPRPLGSVAKNHSWGKFLELIFYTELLQPSHLCDHAPSTNDIIHFLRVEKNILSFSVDPRKPGKESVALAMEGSARKSTKEERVVRMRKDIDDYFSCMGERLAVLRHKLHVDEASHSTEDEEAETSKSSSQGHKAELLAVLTAELEHTHSALHELLLSTPAGQVNDVRRQFVQKTLNSSRKITNWQKTYGIEESFDDVPLRVPEYVSDATVHTIPGSAILVRENEPSSLIAHTLSSLAYFTELANGGKSLASDEPIAGSGKTPVAHSKNGLDEESTSETWIIKVKRLDHPRDRLSLRTSKVKKNEFSTPLTSRLPMSLTPQAPSTKLSLQQVEGSLTTAATQEPPSEKPKQPVLSKSESGATTLHQTPPNMTRRLTNEISVSAPPPSAFRPTGSVSSTAIASKSTSASAASTVTPETPEAWGSVTSSVRNSFNQLLKIGSDVGETMGSIRVKGTDRPLSKFIDPLGLMSPTGNDPASTDERPHIEFRYTLGSRLKLSCTVYYATAFDSLRRRCAIDKSLVTSLERTDVWDAQGGKSKASFFMTKDKRYIVKELVSKWHVSDPQAMLDIAPAYLEHLAGTHNRATSLAKIVGFYNVRIDDLQSGTRKQLDLLVMENIFYKQTISKTFDLKGIESRKVTKVKVESEGKADATSGSVTLFDGDWLESMQKGLILLQPHAKRILAEAISLDTRFLSSQSIMDYSLLLGLDETRKEIVVGLVDAIGSYDFFKTIESRGKMVINRGGEVTIIPPDQYRERFENALKQYFIACPDKWTKTTRRGRGSVQSGVPAVL